MEKYYGLDANESAFFTRELASIKTKTYDVVYPELSVLNNIPVDAEQVPGAEYEIAQHFDRVGSADLITNYSDDLPLVDVKGTETTTKICSFGGAYTYTFQEIQASAFANKNLPAKKALAVRKICDYALDTVALLARPGVSFQISTEKKINFGTVYGLLYHPGVSVYTVAAEGGSYLWSAKTDAAILNDLNTLAWYSAVQSNGIEQADTIGLPLEHYRRISTSYRSTQATDTILNAFLSSNPWIKKVIPIPRLASISPLPSAPSGSGTSNVAIAFKADPDKVALRLTQVFTQYEPQLRNLAYVIPCQFRTAGVISYYPKSISIVEGI